MFNNPNLKPSKVLKIIGIVIVAAFVLIILFGIFGASFNSLQRAVSPSYAPSTASNYNSGSSMDIDFPQEFAGFSEQSAPGFKMPSLSIRNILPQPPTPGSTTTGSDAEDFEVTEYRGRIESNDVEGTCATIKNLKAKDYVIFERANENERSCSYTFKVKAENVEEVLAVIETLDPKELTENTYTIKSQIEDFTSEIEILDRKLTQVTATLDNALIQYDGLTGLANTVQDVESLSRIIENKLQTMERLTNEQITISNRLEQMARAKAEQLDKLAYTVFQLTVTKDVFIDGDNIKNSWKIAIKRFVNDTNNIIQGVSVALITFILRVIQYALYLIVVLVVLRILWNIFRRMWPKKEEQHATPPQQPQQPQQ